MKKFLFLVIVISLLMGCNTISKKLTGAETDGKPTKSNSSEREVYINDEQLSDEIISRFETKYRIRIEDGEYWYDDVSGAWGIIGGPALGLILADMDIGGTLKEDASDGNTGVFINGRELHRTEVAYLQTLGEVQRGRYWLDREGNVGYEGNDNSFANLYQLMRQKGGNTFYRNSYTGTGSGGDGETFYVIGKDWSYIK